MKYVLTTSIPTKCRLLTSKVNFVVTTAFCYALRATYFITQRAEAQLVGAAQSSNGNKIGIFCKYNDEYSKISA